MMRVAAYATVSSSELRRGRRRSLLWLLSAILIVFVSCSASAQELPSLREDMKNLSSIVEQQHVLLPHPLPLLPEGIPFQKIAWDIVGLQNLIKYGLVDLITDRQTLSTFVESALRDRLNELGVSGEIAVSAAPLDGLRNMPCDTLRLGFYFRAFEVATGSSEAVAIVINLISWQGAFVERPDGSQECMIKRAPTWAQLDNTKLFLVDRGNGAEMMAEARRATLELIDYSVLRRIARSNKNAMDRIESWMR
jgi:hypothetical protein